MPYGDSRELTSTARVLGRILRFVPSPEVTISFYRVFGRSSSKTNLQYPDIEKRYRMYGATVASLCIRIASKERLAVSLPLFEAFVPARFINMVAAAALRSDVPIRFPLDGGQDKIIESSKRFVLDTYIKRRRTRPFVGHPEIDDPAVKTGVSEALETRRDISVRYGPNIIHEILDVFGEVKKAKSQRRSGRK